ncbi:hypothetical protein T484DRAFT_1846606, partial [Baffinella frigidus]
VHVTLHARDVALQKVEQSLQLRKVISDRRGQAEALVLLGELHADQGDGANARSAYQEALELRSALFDQFGRGECLCALGTLEAEEGRFPSAIAMHQVSPHWSKCPPHWSK